MENKTLNKSDLKIIPALIIALGIAMSGYFISNGIKFFRNFERSVEVKGLSEKNVKSDLASWNISFNLSGDNLKDMYKQVNTQQQTITDFLVKNGFNKADIQLGTITVNDNWANQYGSPNAKLSHYQITNNVNVSTTNVDLLENVSQHAGELVDSGVIISNNNISYFYNDLNSIKAQMLDEATKNAKVAAKTFAQNSQSQLGKIQSASQGVFTISSPDGSITGDTTSINKKVRVVTSVKFFLN